MLTAHASSFILLVIVARSLSLSLSFSPIPPSVLAFLVVVVVVYEVAGLVFCWCCFCCCCGCWNFNGNLLLLVSYEPNISSMQRIRKGEIAHNLVDAYTCGLIETTCINYGALACTVPTHTIITSKLIMIAWSTELLLLRRRRRLQIKSCIFTNEWLNLNSMLLCCCCCWFSHRSIHDLQSLTCMWIKLFAGGARVYCHADLMCFTCFFLFVCYLFLKLMLFIMYKCAEKENRLLARFYRLTHTNRKD